MPVLINGFGTWHIGRGNVHSTLDHCDQCGALVTLTSYNTRRFIMVLYVPLVPLGKYRVLNHCGQCDKFRNWKLASWESGKAEMRAKVLAAAQQHLDSGEAVTQILHPLIAFQDAETFATVAPPLRERYAGDAFFLMHLGNAYTYFNQLHEAEEAYGASLDVGDSQECRERLAWLLLLAERPDEAWPLLEHIVQTRNTAQSGLLFHLAVSYQALGKHQEALTLVNAVYAAFPETQNDKDWAKLRTASQKNAASGKQIKKGSLAQTYKPAKQRTGRWALVLGPIAIAILIGAYLFACVNAAKNRTIYAVNGLAIPYEFQFDDSTMKLAPNGYRPVQADEGLHRYRVDALGIPEETFDLHTNFFLRPFQEREVFVLNPDRVAVLLKEDSEYMEHVDDTAKYEYTIATNGAFHHFHDIHFPFQDFPEELDMTQAREMRRRVSAIPVMTSYEAMQVLSGEVDDDAFNTHMLRRFHYTPEDSGYSQVLVAMLGFEGFVTEAQVELARRPVLVEVHRSYQSVTEVYDPERDLEHEYATLLAADPENGELIYLLGRVTPEPDRASELFRRAAAPPYGCQYAVAALAFDSLAQGELDEAKNHFDSVSGDLKDGTSYAWIGVEIQIARGEYDAVLDGLARSDTGVPATESDALADVHFRTLKGELESSIQKRVDEYCAMMRLSGADSGTIDAFRRTAVSVRAYASGDLDGYFASTDVTEYSPLQFEYALHQDDLDTAASLLETEDMADATNHLALCISAFKAGNSDLAETHRGKGAELLAAGNREERYYAACLLGTEPFDVDRALRSGMMPDMKRVVLAALAGRYPEHAAPLNAMARKLNYSVSFPHYVLAKALAEPEPAPEPVESAVTSAS